MEQGNHLPIQLLRLPISKVGQCWVCGRAGQVLTIADNSVKECMCEHCGALALANEKWLCVHLPEAGIRHPKNYEHFR